MFENAKVPSDSLYPNTLDNIAEPVTNDVNPKLLLEFLYTICDDTLPASEPYEPLCMFTSPIICVEPVI